MAAVKTKTRKTMSAEEIEAAKAQRAERVAVLEEAAEYEMDGGRELRAFRALCEHYSEGNAVLILAQAARLGLKVDGPEDVGGFWTWKDRNRPVRKGEHQSIFIWQPAGSSAKADKTEEATEAGAEGVEGKKVRKFFKVGGLFHVSQVDEVDQTAPES